MAAAAAPPPPAMATCPVCSSKSLAQHCPSPTCDWNRCRTNKCRATLDLRRRRGYVPNADGTSRAITLTA